MPLRNCPSAQPARGARRSPSLLLSALWALPGFGVAATAPPPTPTEPASSVIERLELHESAAPVRERKGWRPPRRVVLLGYDPRTAGERDLLAQAVPGAQFIVARNRSEAITAASSADVLIGFNPDICDPRIIDGARELRWILSLAAGVEHCVSLPSVRERKLLITNMRGIDSAAIAEHAIALALALAHGLDTYIVDSSQGHWARDASTPMQLLAGKTLLVVGLGGIGTDVARLGHGLGMKVVATRGSGRTGPDFVSYVGTPQELTRLARDADVIVNAAPLTAQTQGLFDAKFFAGLKPTAFFINVARGQSVVTADLARALDAHRLAGAGLDVADPEPLPPDHPLWRAPHVIITPHISSVSDQSGNERWVIARENLRRYAAGDRMLSVVDLEKQY